MTGRDRGTARTLRAGLPRPHPGAPSDDAGGSRARQSELRRRRHHRRRRRSLPVLHPARGAPRPVQHAASARVHLLRVHPAGRRRPRHVRLLRGAQRPAPVGAAAGRVAGVGEPRLVSRRPGLSPIRVAAALVAAWRRDCVAGRGAVRQRNSCRRHASPTAHTRRAAPRPTRRCSAPPAATGAAATPSNRGTRARERRPRATRGSRLSPIRVAAALVAAWRRDCVAGRGAVRQPNSCRRHASPTRVPAAAPRPTRRCSAPPCGHEGRGYGGPRNRAARRNRRCTSAHPIHRRCTGHCEVLHGPT